MDNFLFPCETDVELVGLYSLALTTGGVTPVWSPVMYLIAVHHVNSFLFLTADDGNEVVRGLMWSRVLASGDKVEY